MPAAHAAVLTFAPAADSYVSETSPTTTHGSLSYMRAQASPRRVSYLRFDLSGLTGSVQKATLRVHARTSADSLGVDLHGVSSNLWTEGGLTYSNAPPIGASVHRSGGFSAGAWVSLDATQLVQGGGLVSMAIGTVSSTRREFDTRESAYGPQLVVETTDETPNAFPPANTSAPTVSGTPQVGQVLTAAPGSWSGTEPISYSYQWERCDSTGASCTGIAGATATTYAIVSADLGSTLRVSVTASNASGSALASSAHTSAVTASGSVGYRGPSTAGAGVGPTGSKPESKLWWNDGAWWASMWAGSGSGQGFHIFRLDLATQRWIDTGVQLDDRAGTRADVLWDGTHLYVASHVFSTCGCSTSSPGKPSRLYRYSYNPVTRSYSLDPGFPVAINDTSTETLVIDKDSTGTLWATWAQDKKVLVSHTVAGDDRTWVTPYVIPSGGASNLASDDISTLVAFGGNKIGVMWSNQTDSAMYFAIHADGAADSQWTASPAIQSPLYADDHANLRSLQSDGSGRVFAVIKTSLNDAPTPDANAPIVLLLVRNAAGNWSNHPVWRVGDGSITRPILIIDESNLALHVFASSSESGGTIRTKTSSISSISFPVGVGTVFLRDASQTNALNNATAGKRNVTRQSGLVVLASNDSSSYYWHNYKALP
ncbi:MAG: DNRLRE domain-containing protein [Thermoleophilaceae bacterium]|nr:DNRLRE domain-containing protein [Thermoleophilaceae bacterium]